MAGNSITRKVSINKSDKICLDNVCITPKAKFMNQVEEKRNETNGNIVSDIMFYGTNGYTFEEGDVVILATPTNYYGGNQDCAYNIFNYRSVLNKGAYVIINDWLKNGLNNSSAEAGFSLGTIGSMIIEEVNASGGTYYMFVVSKDVANKELGIAIEKSTFAKDPLGWALISCAVIGLIYLGLKLTLLRKRVRVLK